MVNTLIILAGGDGTRLREVTGNVSKPLVKIGDYPIITKIVEKLSADLKVSLIYFLIQKKHHLQYLNYLEDFNGPKNYNIQLIVEEEKPGTGGAIKNFLHLYDKKEFYVANADTLIKTNISKFRKAATNSILCTKVKNNSRFGSVEINSNNKIVKFEQSNRATNVVVSTGIYKLESSLFENVEESVFDLEKTIFPVCAEQRKLNCFQMRIDFEDIGVPDAYYREVKKHNHRPENG